MAVDAKSLLSSAKLATKASPQKMVADIAAKPLRQIAKLEALALGALALWAMSLGKAAFTGFVIGATAGGTIGTIAGAAIGFSAPPILWPVTVPLGMFIGGTTGALIGGVAGALIAYGFYSGSTTAVTTGIGASIGGVIGGYAGFVVGTFLAAGLNTAAAAFTAFAFAACATTLVGCLLVPPALVFQAAAAALSPVIIMTSTALGALAGAFIFGAIGWAVGKAITWMTSTIGVPASGALAGAGVGFMVGGPVGALVGAGIGYFAAGGWSQVKQAFGTAAGVPAGAAGGIAGFFAGAASTIGTAIASAASTIWGVITSAGGGLIGGIASVASGVFGGLTSATSAVAGSVATTAVSAAVGTVAVGGTLVGITTATSFFSPQQDAVIGGTGDNDLFTIQKTVTGLEATRIKNSDLPKDMTYSIKITAKENITVNSITDTLQVQGENGNFTITQDKDGNPLPPCPKPESISAGETWSCQFTVRFENKDILNLNDSIATNTVTVEASRPGQFGFIDSDFAIVSIGTPPTDCPRGWPMAHGTITQGPLGLITPTLGHKLLLVRYGEQAIDIGGNPPGTPAFATFNGKVVLVEPDNWNGGYGKTVEIEGTCGNTFFKARWSHLESFDPAIKVGSTVQFGQRIGGIDATGINVGGDHLHYSLFGLDIILHVPQEFPQDCLDAACGVSW